MVALISCESNNAQKTASGLYYVITQAGNGGKASNGQEVSMNYTGTLLDGTKFDSKNFFSLILM